MIQNDSKGSKMIQYEYLVNETQVFSLAISFVGNRVMILCSKGFYSCISRKSCSFTSVISKSIVEETSSLAYALRVTCQKPQNWHIADAYNAELKVQKSFCIIHEN